jgi:hypothetical protein
MGSINETLAGLDVLSENEIISDVLFEELMARCENISKQLGGFKSCLK